MNVSFEDLWRCYRACRRTKRATFNALAFEVDAEAKLLDLQRELRERTYRPGPSICFVTDGPKPREVFAADFRDRIVHHVLAERQARVFEPRFIHDSYACRPGKGTLAASDRLMALLRCITANGRRPAWAIKLDVASFFASIDKQTLFHIICRQVRDPEIRWLTHVVLFHDPTADYRFRPGRRRTAPPGDPRYPVPAAKSLFGGDNRRGLPIGNLTSQFWANVYLDELDQFAKRRLGCHDYLRYVDDVVLLAERAEPLRVWRDAIAAFLPRVLRLRLRAEPAEPFPVARGIEFVGWQTWWSHRVVRRQTLATLDAKLNRHARRHVRRAFAGAARRVDLGPVPLSELHATLASYSGHLRHGATWAAWERAWATRPWLDLLFARSGWRLHQRWPPATCGGLVRRYRALLRRAPGGCLVFFPAGRFIEFYGPQRLRAESVLGLRRARLVRGDWAFTAGFPRRWAAIFALRALRHGCSVVLVGSAEDGRQRRAHYCTTLLVPCHLVA